MARSVIILIALFIVLIPTTIWASHNAPHFGVDWSEVGTNALVSASQEHNVAVFNDELYAIGGTVATVLSEKVFKSSDGASWAEVGTDVLPAPRRQACTLIFNNTLWLIGGRGPGGTYVRTVYMTTDGSTWSEMGTNTLPHGNGVSLHACAVKDDQMWIFGGYDGTSNYEQVYSSTDGLIWDEVGTNALPVGTRQHKVLVKDSIFYLIGGDAEEQSVYQSNDGATWSLISDTAVPQALEDHGGVVADGRMWLVGGRPSVGDPPTQTVYASSSGESWTEIGQNSLPAVRHSFGDAVLFNGRMYVIGGSDGAAATETVYRTDDITGTSELQHEEDVIGELASPIDSFDQSDDPIPSGSFIFDIVAQKEADTGYPLVQLVFVLFLLMLSLAVGLFISQVAPDNPLLGMGAVMAIMVAAFITGQGAIPWYVFLGIGALCASVISIRRAL